MRGWEPRGEGEPVFTERALPFRLVRGLEGEPGVELGTRVRPGAWLHAERLGVSIRIPLDGQATGGGVRGRRGGGSCAGKVGATASEVREAEFPGPTGSCGSPQSSGRGGCRLVISPEVGDTERCVFVWR